MMKKTNFFLSCLLIVSSLLPTTLKAQDYNLSYTFSTNYSPSEHRCTIESSTGYIVEGGTVENPNMLSETLVELGLVDPSSGNMAPGPITYGVSGTKLKAVDLVESYIDFPSVICVANLDDNSGPTEAVSIFKTDPTTGTLTWATIAGKGNGQHYAAAITSDNSGNYYVLGYTKYQSQSAMYLFSITETGSVNWEQYYSSSVATDHLFGVDLVFDGTDIVIAGNHFSGSTPNGVVVAKIDTSNGSLLNQTHVPTFNAIADFQVTDMELINGNYYLVGKVNSALQKGFLFDLTPALGAGGINKLYNESGNSNMFMTGIQQIGTDLYMSYDLDDGTLPGFLQTNNVGVPGLSYAYHVDGHVGSKGLLALSSDDLVLKGYSSSSIVTSKPALTMVGTQTPLVSNTSVCNTPISILYTSPLPVPVPITLNETQVEHWTDVNMNQKDIHGVSYDCLSNLSGNFRLATPTGIEENDHEDEFNVLPNPSNGLISIQLSENLRNEYNEIEVLNLLGETVSTATVDGLSVRINLYNQAAGVYLIRLKSPDGLLSETKRFLIK